MTTYTHKKSLRHVTDEQFSENTTVDGSRIDKALQESVDHVNNIPPGDVLSRYTESKFVFGYRPFRDYGEDKLGVSNGCNTSMALPPAHGDFYYAHHFPWMQIANNADLTLGEAADAQNRRVVKTVRLGGDYDGYYVTNNGSVAWDVPASTLDWVDDWDDWASATAQGFRDYTTEHGPRNGYQYAYTNSWNFNRPSIIDDLMVAFTVDSFRDPSYHSANADFTDTSSMSVVLMVDNHFSQELREDSEIEIVSNRYNLSGFRYTTYPATTSSSWDMSPGISKTPLLADPTGGLSRSVILRWRDLNIPLHDSARVRLSIVIPWTKFGLKSGGMTPGNRRAAPFFYASPRGCMTVLEELVA